MVDLPSYGCEAWFMGNDEFQMAEADSLSGFLYARPSFLEGAARALDLGGTMAIFNESVDGDMADFLAISADWQRVGQDMRDAIRVFAKELSIAR
jgi:hypothetical protein